jgi:ubiquinone/menaquinone biosynthesis C-methylase UbiE
MSNESAVQPARITEALRRSLLGNPPWLIDSYTIKGDEIRISGWALPPEGNLDLLTFMINGRILREIRYGLPSPSLGTFFPFAGNVGYAAFTCTDKITADDRTAKRLHFAAVNSFTHESFYEWFDCYLPLDDNAKIVIPGQDQLRRTQGNISAERYLLHGFTTYTKLDRILQRYAQRPLASFSAVLDWGCGCGRLTQHVARHHGSSGTVLGVDIDAANIAWCRDNISSATFRLLPLQPPTDLPASTFDCIYGISVLTHMDEPTQLAWLDELARVARPGAFVLLTVHGFTALSRVPSDDIVRNILAHGFDASAGDRSLDRYIADQSYYKTTYHSRRYIGANFGKVFDVLDVLPAANAGIQDIVVMRKR